MEIFDLATKDNVTLSAILWDRAAAKSVLLLHMMPATKESWTDLANLLSENGFNALAIDFRGHGESGGGDYTKFTPEEHQQYYLDVEAAMLFLSERYPGSQAFIGGASIGANLALKYLSEHSQVQKAFALSAGLDYYGVRAIDYVKELKSDQSILLVGARDDVRKDGADCGAQAEQLYDLAVSSKDKIVYETGGHGTNMFAQHPDLPEKIIHFLTA